MVMGMTISAYQIDAVIKAYSKQSKTRLGFNVPQANSPDNKYADVVTLSSSEDVKSNAMKKISYSLLDVLLKEKK
jgi:co-chaperonin GroES (HSP10)